MVFKKYYRDELLLNNETIEEIRLQVKDSIKTNLKDLMLEMAHSSKYSTDRIIARRIFNFMNEKGID